MVVLKVSAYVMNVYLSVILCLFMSWMIFSMLRLKCPLVEMALSSQVDDDDRIVDVKSGGQRQSIPRVGGCKNVSNGYGLSQCMHRIRLVRLAMNRCKLNPRIRSENPPLAQDTTRYCFVSVWVLVSVSVFG